MTRTGLILSTAVLCCLAFCVRVDSQEPEKRDGAPARDMRTDLLDGEINVALHELELKMSELAVEEARVELAKIELQLEAAQQLGNAREVATIRLELKQAEIRVSMRKVQSDMARLELKRATLELKHAQDSGSDKSSKPSRVQVEYLDDLGVIVLRGAQRDVARIRALFEAAEDKEQ